METFALDPRSWRIGVIFSRNPLLRRTDRIEALIMFIGLAVLLTAVPVAAIVGAMIYGAHDRLYAQEARVRHIVIATVTDSRTGGWGMTIAQAKWPVSAGERTGPLELTNAATVGDRIDIWVDDDGNPVAPPTPTWQALGDGIAMTMSTLLLVGVGMTAVLCSVRSWLDRSRDARWEREITCLEEDGGRTNQH